MIPLKSKNIFISKKEVLKLDLMNHLLENGTVNVDDLIDLYDISQRTAKNLVLELIEEVYSIDNSLDISLSGNTLKFGSNFSSRTYLTAYKTMQLNYYENSMLFQLFILLFKYKTLSVYDLSEKLVISPSYLYKIIKSLSKQLEIWDFDIQIDVKAYKVSFSGDEIEIRCLAYYVFSLVFNTLNSKFKPNVPQATISFVSKNYSNTTNHLITIVQNIFVTRQQQSFHLPELNKAESDFIGLIKQKCPRYSLSSLDSNEASYILLWLVYVVPELITLNEKITIGEYLWLSNEEDLTIFKPFIEAIKDEFECTEEVMYLLMWEYYSRFIIYRFFKSWKYKNIIDIKRTKNKYIDRINELSSIYFKDFLPSLGIKQYIDELSELTYSYLNLFVPVKIYVDLFEYSSIKIFIENILGRSYNKEVLLFTDNPNEAHLIITNVIPTENNNNTELFFFTDINSKVNWEELGKAIQRQILILNWGGDNQMY